MQTLDLEPYSYTGMNFTGIRMIDPDNEKVQELYNGVADLGLSAANELRVEHALMFDAVHLFAHAFKQLSEAIEGDVKQLACNASENWEHGISLSNFMRSVSIFLSFFFNFQNFCSFK